MKFYGDDGILFRSMEWLVERVFMPIFFVMLVICLVVPMGAGAYFGWHWVTGPAEKVVELRQSEWTCTQPHKVWIAPYSCGTAKTRSTCGGYWKSVCRQWTADQQ